MSVAAASLILCAASAQLPGGTASAESRPGFGPTPADVFQQLMAQYGAAVAAAGDIAQAILPRGLGATGHPTIPTTGVYARLGRIGQVVSAADIYAAIWRAELLPVLTENTIGLAALRTAPGIDPETERRLPAAIAYDNRLAHALRLLSGGARAVTRVNASSRRAPLSLGPAPPWRCCRTAPRCAWWRRSRHGGTRTQG